MNKRCCKCKEIKHITEFQLNKSNKDGYQKRCKKCRSEHLKTHPRFEYLKQWYQDNKDIQIKKNSEYRKTEKWKIANKKGNEKYVKNNPNKKKAHTLISNSVKLGKIPNIKTLTCSVCKNKQAEHYHHHKGYEEKHWLDVIPVCKVCHNDIHHK